MDPLLGNPAVQFVPIEKALEVARRRIAQAPPEEAQEINEFLERYYFHSAGADRRVLADELKSAVKARREGEPGA